MTTEVLRNMLYAGSRTLRRPRLCRHGRGALPGRPVPRRGWEEVIIHLPESVRLVALSATVSNAEEFGEWMVTSAGTPSVIVDDHRPVPLWQHMLAGRRLHDLFVEDALGRPDGATAALARAASDRDLAGPAGRRCGRAGQAVRWTVGRRRRGGRASRAAR